ncbi:MAG TPA: hypothetical protein VFV08_12280, partial [Puia sp.]|nr:hypothetical protein [Puia sp.]
IHTIGIIYAAWYFDKLKFNPLFMSKWSFVFAVLSLFTGIYSFQSDSPLAKLLFFGSILCLYVVSLGKKRSLTSKRMFVASTGILSVKFFNEVEHY